MKNEELAVRAQNHEEWATLELWEAVRRFVAQEAYRYLQRGENRARVEHDDLMQSGFLAMLDAVRIYDPEREAKFLTVMGYTLKNRFAEAGGHRSRKRDPLSFADSLDVPAYRDDAEGENAVDLVPDQCSEYAFLKVEFSDFIAYCHNLIIAAMEILSPSQRALIMRRYYRGETLAEIGKAKNMLRQDVDLRIRRSFYRLRHGRYHIELREALRGFDDFRELAEERDRRELESMAIQKREL